MIHAYNEFYLNDAKQNLAVFFDYAINDCGVDADLFARIFVQSGYADKFERGNPAIIAGMSGVELAKKVLLYVYPNWNFPDRTFLEECSPVYWAGWALAEYQWVTCKRFKNIFSRITFSEVISMYHVYHEIGVSLRSIQMYEQKVNDIDKAQARTVYKLSRVLGCTVEDLLENPEL